MLAFEFLRRGVQETRGGAVDDGDLAVGIEPDHAGADAGQHGFGEAAAFVDLAVGGDQRVALGIELLGHAVEGQAQRADFVVVALDFDLRLEVAFRDAFGRADQARDRLHQPVGGPQAQPDRRQQDDQRNDAVEAPRRRSWTRERLCFRPVIFVDRDLGALVVAEHLRDRPCARSADRRLAARAAGSARARCRLSGSASITMFPARACSNSLGLGGDGSASTAHSFCLDAAQNLAVAVDDVGRLQTVVAASCPPAWRTSSRDEPAVCFRSKMRGSFSSPAAIWPASHGDAAGVLQRDIGGRRSGRRRAPSARARRTRLRRRG